MQQLLSPQDMNMIGWGWVWYYAGFIGLVVAIICVVGGFILLVGRQRVAANSVFGAAALIGIISAVVFFVNMYTGHERYHMIHDLESASWTVVSVDETKDSAVVAVKGDQRQVILVQTGLHETWTAFQRCQIIASSDTGPTVQLSSCAYAANTSR